MNKNKIQTIVLRAGISLSLLLGASLQAKQVAASDEFEDSNKESSSTELISKEETSLEDDILKNDKVQETNDENSEQQELDGDIDSEPKEILEDVEVSPKDKSEDSESLHNKESSMDEMTEEESQIEEEVLVDGVVDEEGNPTETEEVETDDDEEIREDNDITELDKETDNEMGATLNTAPASLTASSESSDETVQVDRLHGQNRFKNAVEISKKGWTSAPKVFLANGYKFTDSLTGSPLAALNDAPILLTRDNSLPEVTLAELKRLNAKEIVILGGDLSIPEHIASTLKQNGFNVTRIGGNNRYNQAELVANEIMKVEGNNRDAFLASGEVFSDALSVATVSSNKRLPIYLTRGNRLEQSVLNAIPHVNSWTIIGGELSINQSVENEMKDAGAKVKRIDGRDRYEVNRNVLNYYGVPKDHLYVSSGEHYSDTLPASVLASKEKSGVLLVRDNRKKTNDKQKVFAQNKHNIRNFTFIGGPLTLSEQTKNDFKELVSTVDDELLAFIQQQFNEHKFSHYNIRLSEALNMQMLVNPQTDKKYTAFISKNFVDSTTNTVTADVLNVRSGAGSNHHVIAQLQKGGKIDVIKETGNWYQIDLKQMWLNANRSDVNYYLNPNNFILSERQMFQFLDLSKTSSATPEELNKFLDGKGILHGMGQSFIDAGKKHGVNEIYLLSHALLETGNGTSTLATGVQVNGDKVYNMYGIGAYDNAAVTAGSKRAHQEGWFTPEDAIIGGAAFIGNNYVKAGQNTLYKMRWNPESMDNQGYASHQYATDIGWSYKQVNTMYNLYNSIGIDLKYLDIPVYLI